jgi:putative oxidoreductase
MRKDGRGPASVEEPCLERPAIELSSQNILLGDPTMEWERLARFVLLGSGDLEQYAILLVRVSLGLFFAISGANKLFVASRTQAMYETLAEAKVPFPHAMTYFVSAVELVGGCLLAVGLLSSLACVALLVDMLTAKLSAMPNGLSALNWLDNFLYLPEVLYVLFFIWLICSGPGKFSVDYWLAEKLWR